MNRSRYNLKPGRGIFITCITLVVVIIVVGLVSDRSAPHWVIGFKSLRERRAALEITNQFFQYIKNNPSIVHATSNTDLSKNPSVQNCSQTPYHYDQTYFHESDISVDGIVFKRQVCIQNVVLNVMGMAVPVDSNHPSGWIKVYVNVVYMKDSRVNNVRSVALLKGSHTASSPKGSVSIALCRRDAKNASQDACDIENGSSIKGATLSLYAPGAPPYVAEIETATSSGATATFTVPVQKNYTLRINHPNFYPIQQFPFRVSSKDNLLKRYYLRAIADHSSKAAGEVTVLHSALNTSRYIPSSPGQPFEPLLVAELFCGARNKKCSSCPSAPACTNHRESGLVINNLSQKAIAFKDINIRFFGPNINDRWLLSAQSTEITIKNLHNGTVTAGKCFDLLHNNNHYYSVDCRTISIPAGGFLFIGGSDPSVPTIWESEVPPIFTDVAFPITAHGDPNIISCEAGAVEIYFNAGNRRSDRVGWGGGLLLLSFMDTQLKSSRWNRLRVRHLLGKAIKKPARSEL